MPPDPPEPVSATLSIFTGLARVTFDQPLTVGPIAAPNWTARVNNVHRTFGPVTVPNLAPFKQVNCQTSVIGGPDPGPDAIAYAPPPFDVVASATGNPAAAFADFPLTVVP